MSDPIAETTKELLRFWSKVLGLNLMFLAAIFVLSYYFDPRVSVRGDKSLVTVATILFLVASITFFWRKP